MNKITEVRAGPDSRGDHQVRARAAAVVGAITAALTVWFVAEVLFGLDLRSPAANATDKAMDVTAVSVVLVAAVGSLAGWGLLAVLERVTSRPRRNWTVAAILVLLASLSGPLSGHGITTSNRLVLLLLHLVVAAVTIATLARTTKTSR